MFFRNLAKHKIIQGTLLLTIAGIVTRIIGFIYKIFLADKLGARLLGIYQLIFPVYGICFTIYAAGIQTAISQLIASASTKKKGSPSPLKILGCGITFSLLLAFSLSGIVYFHSDFIAQKFLLTASCAPYIKPLCILFPFCSITSCINGYYYGIQDAKVPAGTQIAEQLVRVIFVLSLCYFFTPNKSSCCMIAVFGLVSGEIASMFYNLFHFLFHLPADSQKKTPKQKVFSCRKSPLMRPFLYLSITLTLTKLITSILHSVESVLIPAELMKFGLSNQEALSQYGILSGMSLSFILFPSTITNSFAVMLLPAIAEADAKENNKKIARCITLSIKYSLLIGLFFTMLFLLSGDELGLLFFHNKTAGCYLCLLSWLCPFLYLATTLASILNGMRKTNLTFIITCISQFIKIGILIFFVPKYGMKAYLSGLLLSQMIQAILEYIPLKKYIHPDLLHWIILPGLFLLSFGYLLSEFCFPFILTQNKASFRILLFFLCCLIYGIGYLIYLYGSKLISHRDLNF